VFRWDPASDAISYVLQIDDDPFFGSIDYSAIVGGLEHTIASPLMPDTTYFWQVWGVNPCADGPPSSVFSFTTTIEACQVHSSADVPQIISASGTPSVSSDLQVPALGSILDVDVVNLTGVHTFMQDLDFNLLSPTGTEVQVIAQSCGSTDDFDLELDDEALPGPWPCPPTGGGSYQPSSPLAAFDGEASGGTWTLRIDDNATVDGGELSSWGLRVCALAPVPGADLGVAATVPGRPVFAGSSFTYQVEVTNNGPDPAEGQVLTTDLPAELVLSSTTGCLEDPAGAPTCSLPPLGPGAPAVHVTLTVDVDSIALGPAATTFAVSFPGDDANGANDQVAVIVGIEDPATVIFADGFEDGTPDAWN
jgi:uncharacterized repeat protein (TIGR01451 family)